MNEIISLKRKTHHNRTSSVEFYRYERENWSQTISKTASVLNETETKKVRDGESKTEIERARNISK